VPVAASSIREEPDDTRKRELKAARDITIATNNAIMNLRNESRDMKNAEQVFYNDARRLAKSSSPAVRKKQTDDYRIAAELPGLNSLRRSWVLARAGDTSYALRDYRKARLLANAALESAEHINIDTDELRGKVRSLRASAALTAARANRHLGNSAEAR